MTSWPALLSGLLFGMGLSVSGMTDPAKVQGFLDITGAWVPDLAFVMGGALLITLIMTSAILRRGKPLLASAFNVPNLNTIDRRLIIGSAIFGIGWGLAGLCPGGVSMVGRWCGEAVARLWRGCGEAAARVWRGCGEGVARV